MAPKDLDTGLVRPEGPFVRLPFIRKNPANPSAPYMLVRGREVFKEVSKVLRCFHHCRQGRFPDTRPPRRGRYLCRHSGQQVDRAVHPVFTVQVPRPYQCRGTWVDRCARDLT